MTAIQHTVAYTALLVILALSLTINWMFIDRRIYMGEKNIADMEKLINTLDPPEEPVKKKKK